jgi:hypothetical protein
MNNKNNSTENKIQCIPAITISGLLASAINGIVAFVAVYFFKPLWQKIIKLWEPK